MAHGTTRISMACGIAAAIAAAGALAQAQVYRYVDKDGHVVYTDRLPPDAAKDVQAKRWAAISSRATTCRSRRGSDRSASR